MPSPFPGMDPYLELPWVFPDFHNRFMMHVQEAIQPALPGPYYAKTHERVWIERPDRSAIPDVSISRTPWSGDERGTGTAVLERTETEVEIETVELLEGFEVTELSLAIYRKGDGPSAKLVTAIELLSPSNKSPGSPGNRQYFAKQAEYLSHAANLIEIDLLRGGSHATAVPPDLLRQPFDYHICVRDLNLRPELLDLYRLRLENPLPRLAIPLSRGEGYVVVELQPVFDRCYDTGSYRREIDYRTATPDPPLPPERQAWARQRIEAWLAPAA